MGIEYEEAKGEITKVFFISLLVAILISIPTHCAYANPAPISFDSPTAVLAGLPGQGYVYLPSCTFATLIQESSTGLTKFTSLVVTGANWTDIGFAADTPGESMTIVGLTSSQLTFTASGVGVYRVWTTVYKAPLSVTGGTHTWNSTTLETTITTTGAGNVVVDWGNIPTITSATITDMDDTDNLYAMKKYYTFQVVVDDGDGAVDIDKVYLQGKQANITRFEVRATNLTTALAAYTIQTGASVIDLDTGSCSWGEAGNTGTATFKIRFEWDYTQENDIELSVYVEDAETNSAGFTVKQTNYADIITRLVTENLAANSTYIPIGTGVEISGAVHYATTIDGDIASSSYPPDSQFTAVHIHNTTHASQGSDTSIVDGIFSIDFTIPAVEQANTYHVYLDMTGDYTDADAPDGDTVVVYGTSSPLLMSFDVGTGNITYDSSGSNNHGNISGATRTGYGRYGRALTYDGEDDYVQISSSASLNITSPITMMAWIKTNDPSVQGIISKQGAYGLTVISNYAIRVTINTTDIDTQPNLFTPDTWVHITATYNGSSVKIYVNGVLNTTRALASGASAIAKTPNDLYIGNVTTSFFYT